MAKSPNNDADAPTGASVEAPQPPAPKPEAPKNDEGGTVNPNPVTTTNRTAQNEPVEQKRVTLVKGDHKVTTSHPVEINNFRARGYHIEK
ncbi:hypothetical protein [Brevibacterium aurantiacum]|uniref:hypothetical protein n=1 Tax=Brevibacterium aurantiacum TaxID=273384 RepID=UPI003F8DE6A6